MSPPRVRGGVFTCSKLYNRVCYKAYLRAYMFTKFTLAIEKWLRGLIADEVSQLDHDLSNERTALCSTIRVCEAQLK